MNILLGQQAFESLLNGVKPNKSGIFYSRIEDGFIAYCHNMYGEFTIRIFSTEKEGFTFIKENYFKHEKSIPI